MRQFQFCLAGLLLVAFIFFDADEATAAGTVCRDESCFAGQVADCNDGSSFTTALVAEAQVRYFILGEQESGCLIDMVYTQHPDPAWVGPSLTFIVDPGGDIGEQVKSAVSTCLERNSQQWLCDGELFYMTGAVEKPVVIVVATEPPCGVEVSDVGPALYPLPRDGQWGYVTRDGEWVIEPRWSYAEPFSEGRAAVNDNGRWGVIDREGAYVLGPVLRSSTGGSPLQPFSQGCATADVQKDGNPHPFFVDRSGRFWLDDAPLEALGDRNVWEFGRFSGGRAWFRAMGEKLEESFGWIDAQGELVLNDTFSGAGEFVDGRAPAASGGDWWAFIDTEGNPVMPHKWMFKGARPFSEGLAAVEVKQSRWMYISDEGAYAAEKVILDPPRQVIGKMVTELDIGTAGDFHDGLAPVIPSMMFDAEELVYIRPDGTEAFAPGSKHGLEVCQPYRLPEFRDGLLQLLVAREGVDCGNARPGQALTSDNAQYIYLDTDGNIVLRETE